MKGKEKALESGDGRKKGKEKALELASEEVKTKKETGKPFCHFQRKEQEPLRGISVASTSKYISKAGEAGFNLQRRTQSSTPLKKARVNEVTYPGRLPLMADRSPRSVSFKGRCYRCLDTDHRAAFCKAPIRCLRCRKTGHIARACMDRLPMSVYRAMRARPSYLSAFVPLSEDFFARQNRRRNAMLWVPSDQLIRRELLSLDNLRLRCYPWNPYDRARRAQLTYNVWIRLVSLPYECWSSRTVAALVGGFGRFIRADDFSVRMVDLTGYRCLVSVDYLSDIPENLEITVGDSSLSVLIQLERWGRRDAAAPGNPPNDQTDQHDPLQRPPVAPRRSEGSIRGRRSSAGGSSSSDASWNSSEIRDRRRAAYVPDGSTLDAPVAPLRRFVEEEHSSPPVSVERLSPPTIVESSSPPEIAGPEMLVVSFSGPGVRLGAQWGPSHPFLQLLAGPPRTLFSPGLDVGLSVLGQFVGAFGLGPKWGRGHRLLPVADEAQDEAQRFFFPGFGDHLFLRDSPELSFAQVGFPQVGTPHGTGNPSRPLPTGVSFEPVLLGVGDGRGLPVWNPDLHATRGLNGSPGAAAAMGSCAEAPLGMVEVFPFGTPISTPLEGDGRGLPVWNPDLHATRGFLGATAAMGSCAGAPLGTGLHDLDATRGSPGAAAAMGSCTGASLEMGLLLRTGRSRDLAEALSAPNPPEGGDGEEAGGAGYLPSVRRGPTRSSPRARDPAIISALERAKRRKAILLEGAISSSAKLARKWSSKKVLSKGARCGVKLSEVDAEELHKFMLSG
uniref:CCHC-type domain-containing protein n=1 Tax=Ananas comosus var. bracteatus TaxID=296719 RepID=A0A6V7PHG3_ANACO|nr:unnamed protein product [Ananas comosus var. bracteatus]